MIRKEVKEPREMGISKNQKRNGSPASPKGVALVTSNSRKINTAVLHLQLAKFNYFVSANFA